MGVIRPPYSPPHRDHDRRATTATVPQRLAHAAATSSASAIGASGRLCSQTLWTVRTGSKAGATQQRSQSAGGEVRAVARCVEVEPARTGDPGLPRSATPPGRRQSRTRSSADAGSSRCSRTCRTTTASRSASACSSMLARSSPALRPDGSIPDASKPAARSDGTSRPQPALASRTRGPAPRSRHGGWRSISRCTARSAPAGRGGSPHTCLRRTPPAPAVRPPSARCHTESSATTDTCADRRAHGTAPLAMRQAGRRGGHAERRSRQAARASASVCSRGICGRQPVASWSRADEPRISGTS